MHFKKLCLIVKVSKTSLHIIFICTFWHILFTGLIIKTIMSDYHIETFTSSFENLSHVEETRKYPSTNLLISLFPFLPSSIFTSLAESIARIRLPTCYQKYHFNSMENS